MSDKKYVVPEGALEVVDEAISKARLRRAKNFPREPELMGGEVRDITLQAFIRWQSENPILPTDNQIDSIIGESLHYSDHGYDPPSVKLGALQWQRRMYLAEEPAAVEAAERAVWDVFMKRGVTVDDKRISIDREAVKEVAKAVSEVFRQENESERINSHDSEPPREIKDLLLPNFFNAMAMVVGNNATRTEEQYKRSILEAFRRGKEVATLRQNKVAGERVPDTAEPQDSEFDVLIAEVLSVIPITATRDEIKARDTLLAVARKAYFLANKHRAAGRGTF